VDQIQASVSNLPYDETKMPLPVGGGFLICFTERFFTDLAVALEDQYMRDPKKLTLGQILQTDDQLVIPRYQRPYAWKADQQVSEFLDDIEACIDASDGKELFLGTTIVDSGDGHTKSIDLIDGQQRTTTTIIFLVALGQFARDTLKNEQLVDYVQDKIIIESPFPGRPQRNKLVASESVALVFENLCRKDWDGSFPTKLLDDKGKVRGVVNQTKRIKPVYNVLLKGIQDYCKKSPMENFERLTTQLLDRSCVIWIQIEDRSEAFEIFERTNARGKGLEISDLLKNYLFSKEDNLEDDAEEVWKEITSNAGNSILRMLKHFWISRKGYIAKRDLYRSIRKHADEVGINTFTNDLLEFSRFFAAYHSNERGVLRSWLDQTAFKKHADYKNDFVRVCTSYRLFSIAQLVPVVFSAVKALDQSDDPDKSAKVLLNLMRYIEAYHFINNKICNRIGNEVEKTYAEACVRFSKTSDFSESCTHLRQALNRKLANQTEYVGSFSELSYDDANAKHLIRYLEDYMANVGARSGQRVKIYDYFDRTIKDRSNYDIDHIFPQALAKGVLDEDVLHSVGNLLVIPQQINAILGKDDFTTKTKKLRNPSEYDNKIINVPTHVTKFLERYGSLDSWGEKEIKHRTYQMAVESYEALKTQHKY
jgi:hypothetical protein